jgi:hypothetical protein
MRPVKDYPPTRLRLSTITPRTTNMSIPHSRISILVSLRSCLSLRSVEGANGSRPWCGSQTGCDDCFTVPLKLVSNRRVNLSFPYSEPHLFAPAKALDRLVEFPERGKFAIAVGHVRDDTPKQLLGGRTARSSTSRARRHGLPSRSDIRTTVALLLDTNRNHLPRPPEHQS